MQHIVTALVLLGFTSSSAAAQTCPGEDFLAPNFTFASAVPIQFDSTPLTITNLAALTSRPDYFSIVVPPGGSGEFQISYSPLSQSLIILSLYDDSQMTIDTSAGSAGLERVSFFNSDVVSRQIFVDVNSFDVNSCVDYSLEVTTEPGCNEDYFISVFSCFDGGIL